MTPEQLAELRKRFQEISPVTWIAVHALIEQHLPALLDMAERCADYDRRLSAVMPTDFKDWHDNGPKEWPEVAAGTIKRLRERLEQAEAKAETYDRLRQSQREQWSSITRDIVKTQNKQGDA